MTGPQTTGAGAVFGLGDDPGDYDLQHLHAFRDSTGSRRGESFAANRRIRLRPLHDGRDVLQTLFQRTLFHPAGHGQVCPREYVRLAAVRPGQAGLA